MAYVVMRRTREIGIRIALGALRSIVIAMIMREVVLLLGTGLAAGLLLALAFVNLIHSQLYALNPRDPLTFLGSAIVLILAAGVAGFIPALRASVVNPTAALRQDWSESSQAQPVAHGRLSFSQIANALAELDVASETQSPSGLSCLLNRKPLH